ncbi:hypothetical protein JCM8097_000985 [Rhodosporidiobolus ruineniae]
MSDLQSQRCFVCDKNTTQQCAACLDAFFCSRQCQKLAWPAHKLFCKAGGRFVHPPLQPIEVKTLDLGKNQTMMDRGELRPETLLGRVQRRTGYKGNWQNLLDQLSRDDCNISEPTGTGALVILRTRLTAHNPLPPGADRTQPITFWQYSTSALQPFWVESFQPMFARQPDPDLWNRRCGADIIEAAYERSLRLFAQLEGIAPQFRSHHQQFLANSKVHTLSDGKDCPCCTGAGATPQCPVS